MKNRLAFLFKPWFMAFLFIVLSLSMAIATFIENDYGAITAKQIIYEAKWFELIILLIAINLIGQIVTYKLYKKKKLTILIFHVAFLIIIIGSAITRYFGFEGTIHMREGQSNSICSSIDKYVTFSIHDNNNAILYNKRKNFVATALASDNFSDHTTVDAINYDIKFIDYIPNAIEKLVDDPNGKPIVALTVSRAMMGKQRIVLSEGESINFLNKKISFNETDSADFTIFFQNDSFFINSPEMIAEMSMMTRESTIHPENKILPLATMKIYDAKGMRIVVQELSKKGITGPVSVDYQMQQTGQSALIFELGYGNKGKDMVVWLGAAKNPKDIFKHRNHTIKLSYGPKKVELPFDLKLNDFILERYPGSNSPSSYMSDVTLIDKENEKKIPYLIYMNHILKYKGYRFYQTSYDQDEKGTILSVNRDLAGMLVTYTGYGLMILFILVSLLNRHSLFRTINEKFWKPKSKSILLILILMVTSATLSFGQNHKTPITKEKADAFGKLLVQDNTGRTKPLYTLSNDILRKVSRKTEFKGYSSMQVFLGLFYEFNHWKDVPMIKVSNGEIKNLIGIRGDYAAFSDIVDLESNSYKLGQYLEAAYAKPPGSRNKFDKEIIKVDERVNICFMINQGEFLKIFPLRNETDKWGTANEAIQHAPGEMDSLFISSIFKLYYESLQQGNISGDNSQAGEYLLALKNYQQKYSKYDLPQEKKIKAEIFYYKVEIFEKLFPFYALLGISILFVLLFGIIRGKSVNKYILKTLTGILFIGFLAHTGGLALRWYISGHAPMSNGYESMIFISWVTIFAGFIFSRKSLLTLSATSILAALTLMVAHLSFMDPQITNLVPVLKSYWLTLHVSVITGSYGFLGLGAILGIIIMILYISINHHNKSRIQETITELSVINYKSLTIGLYLLTIGTFLGAIWANESWGRYWGWDPKETWSLITILVYSLVIHSRMIPALKSIYYFNFMAIIAFGSVLMTYFGVNYYLSGLHSYAGGDPVPVPGFVYVSVASLLILTYIAYRKFNKYFRSFE